MAKKHWIYIKRGLSEDPKHRNAMGECVWLYMHIIDRADWETGIAFEWKDKDEASEMSMPVDTLRRQRQKLEELEYIQCKQKQHSQDVVIMEWRNPRDYGSEVKNPRIDPQAELEGSHESPPSEIEGLNQGSNQGSNQVTLRVKTPSLDSKTKSKSLKKRATPKPKKTELPKASDIPELVIFKDVVKHYPKPFQRDTVIEAVQKINIRLGREATVDDLCPWFTEWGKVSGNDWSLVWLDWAVAGKVTQNGNSSNKTPQPPAADNFMAEYEAKRERARLMRAGKQTA